MKKWYHCFSIRTISALIITVFVSSLLNAALAQEMIRNGGFEDDSEWWVYDMGSNDMSEVEFGYSEAVPTFGDGGCLRIWGGPSDYTNVLVWQEVDLIGGVEYQISCAFLDLTDDNLPEPEGFWSQIYLSEEEPVEGTDWTPPDGANTEIYLGFNSWSGCSGSGVDGTFEADACDGKNQAYFIAPGDSGEPVLIFAGIKTGVWGTQLSYDVAIDNFSLMGPNETNVDEQPASTPHAFVLEQNYPTPFNAGTTIRYSLSNRDAESVQLKIYDVRGQVVRRLVNQPQSPGSHRIHWDGADDTGHQLASGTYFAELTAGKMSRTIKLTILN